MTKNQITKKLVAAGISLEGLVVRNGSVEIEIGYKEVNGFGQCDEEKVQEAKVLINKAIPELNGGIYTQYGSLELQENFKKSDMGDWNDPSSKWHY